MDLTQRRRRATGRLAAVAPVDIDGLRTSITSRGPPAWLLGILLIAIPSHALAVWRVVGSLPPGTRPPTLDSLIFEYTGWYLTQGGRLYIDIWEVKPPLPFEVAAVVSLMAGGDPVVGHWLHVLLTIGAAVGTAGVAGALVLGLTDDPQAAFAAGVSLYVLPAYHWRVAFGFKPKYFVPLFALLAVYLAHRDRPAGAGVAAGAAVGFWQLAIAVPLLVGGIAYDRGGRRALGRVAAGTIGLLSVAVLPVVYRGALEAMVTETLLVPLLVQDQLSMGARLHLATFLFGGSLPVALVGILGVAAGLRRQLRATWWLGLGTAWFGLLVLAVDLDGPPDLFPVMAFLAVGVGVLLGLEPGHQRPAAVLLAALAVISVVTMGGFGFAGSPLHQPDPYAYEPDQVVEPPYTLAEESHLYWNQEPPGTCRVFIGPTQRELIAVTGQPAVQETCGEAGPVIDVLMARWFG